MMDLDEAWRWYETTREHLGLFARLGMKHWGQFPEDSSLWKDDAFKSLESDAIKQDSRFSLEHLEDFAVMVIFSVFESIVRERVLARIRGERQGIEGVLLGGMIDASLVELKKKSFARILEIFKGMDAGLVEEVNQVRRYRNWVAHGRQSTPKAAVDPEVAFKRLRRFLEAMTQE
jgi:hypothetical protein